ncbi:hypothetical protein Kpol_1016p19 [Vanderwaltozyma polyspora DSM 70294]|uniref:BRCT domain-containing protein n=1 Tax=Vanderwaltozyma polyspora (strain ATCC 22028 / DSM 70294 / BCRC 21397 / CBS 2163 / NBRC 10782 / NRRL Y-8283 / UCD 57-17) TaxID=436907 RepID=A7TNT4_VANPO|nr:uncharacterized protein Kpol_1016p19 [Vanderwaltozyma polyspora DSM 70294]EDO16077.1 hypothetical protein Kpol_1016p19 [Vanderwaltozyma polyspora DSM 70294]
MKPFQGISFCPTGFTDEDLLRSISKKIIKLGGTYSKDLTNSVNVIVIGHSHLTHKYKYSVKNRYDIIFLYYKSILKIYDLWLSGEDVTCSSHSKFMHLKNNNLERMLLVLKINYTASPLHNYQLFIGRISNSNFNIDDLVKKCEKLGVSYCNSTNFIMNFSVTKNKPVLFITDTLNGARVDAAREKNLPVVHFKWILDCERRNATLDYDPYYLLENNTNTPFEKIGLESCDCWDKLQIDMTDDITTINSSSVSISNIDHSNETSKQNSNLLSKFKPRGNKLWERVMNNDSTKTKNIITAVNLDSTDIDTESNLQNKELLHQLIFTDCRFKIIKDFPLKHSQILEKIIIQNGGTMDDIDSKYKFIIVPSNVPLYKLNIEKGDESFTQITEFFIERCLHYKKFLFPVDSWSKPFYHTDNFRIKPNPKLLHEAQESNSDNPKLNVSITGFHGVELLHLLKILDVLKQFGINYNKFLNNSTDLLIINLSSLASIPKDNKLWQNEFSDLFYEQLNSNISTSNNQVFRNSMKRKIEFVKTTHQIPVVTPVFLMNIFKLTKRLTETDKELIHFNNISWCILCPRGRKEDYTCQIKHIPIKNSISSNINKAEHIRDLFKMENIQSQKRKPPTRKIPNELNISNSILPSDNREKNVINQDSDIKNNDKFDSENQFKKRKIHSGNVIKPVGRTSSWGKLMSEEVLFPASESNQDADTLSLDSTKYFDVPGTEANLNYTQVTYGKSNSSEIHQRPIRKLTRKQMREIDKK